ncbi:ATP-dependent RNA helicase RhlB [subsurface metagenome]
MIFEKNILKASCFFGESKKRAKVPIFKKGGLPDIEVFYSTNNDDISEDLKDLNFDEELEKFIAKGLFEIDAEDIKIDFKKDLQDDIHILEKIYNKWFENGIGEDPKLESFVELLKDQLKREPGRKIIVFSEFADTINYLYEQLNGHPNIFKYTSKDATKANKEIIRKNFDAGITAEHQVNDFDVLLATDVISEGYNLHRAGTIFNYDIPYNPTRVIQRVGRINRINKKVFNELYIYNYFPTETGEYETRTREISTLKIAMIHALLGEDTKILTNDEELRSYYREIYEREIALTEEPSWENPYKNLYDSLVSSNSDAFQKALEIPVRTRIRRTSTKNHKGVVVFGKKGTDFIFRLGSSDKEDKPLPPHVALSLFEAKPTEKPEQVSEQFNGIYEFVKNNLFTTKTQVQSEKLKRMVKNKINLVLKDELYNEPDYLKDLLSVIELDALPKHYLRFINQLSVNEFEKIKEEIPHRYIMTIIEKANKIDAGEEILILSEELP